MTTKKPKSTAERLVFQDHSQNYAHSYTHRARLLEIRESHTWCTFASRIHLWAQTSKSNADYEFCRISLPFWMCRAAWWAAWLIFRWFSYLTNEPSSHALFLLLKILCEQHIFKFEGHFWKILDFLPEVAVWLFSRSLSYPHPLWHQVVPFANTWTESAHSL